TRRCKQCSPRANKLLLGLTACLLLSVSSLMLYHSLGSYFKGLAAASYKMTDATVEKLEEHFDPFGIRKEVQLVFQVDKQEKHALVELPADRVMKKGELTVLFYDPANPANAVLSQQIDYDSIQVFGAFGLFAFCFGALLASKVFLKD